MSMLNYFSLLALFLYLAIDIPLLFLIYGYTKNWDVVYELWVLRKTGKDYVLPQHLQKLLKISEWIRRVFLISVALVVIKILFL